MGSATYVTIFYADLIYVAWKILGDITEWIDGRTLEIMEL